MEIFKLWIHFFQDPKKKKNSNGIDKASKTVDTSGTLQNMLSISTIQVELHLYSRAMAVINAVSWKKFPNRAHYKFITSLSLVFLNTMFDFLQDSGLQQFPDLIILRTHLIRSVQCSTQFVVFHPHKKEKRKKEK